MTCAQCSKQIVGNDFTSHNDMFFHSGDGRWDASSCYHKYRDQEIEDFGDGFATK